MSVILYYILPFIIVLGVLIFFHELGHFLVAKLFNVKVLKFSLGFGYKLIGKTVGETEYLISTIPLGGYVKMLGENEDQEEPVPPWDQERAFNNQHVLKRIAIVAAGPVFNMLLAVLLFCGLYLISGNQVMVPEIGQVRADSPAEKAGLKKGDLIVTVQGQPIESWAEIKEIVNMRPGQPVIIDVKRGADLLPFTVVPEETTVKNLFGEDVKSALIGIVASGQFKTVPLSPFQAVREGILKTWEITELTLLTVVKLFQRVVPLKTLGGPIMIGQMTGQLAQENFSYLIPFMAVISVNLAILNLLPVPILDGGVILFCLIELLIGKPISLKKRDLAQKVGLFLLLCLMAVVFYNDLARLFQ